MRNIWHEGLLKCLFLSNLRIIIMIIRFLKGLQSFTNFYYRIKSFFASNKLNDEAAAHVVEPTKAFQMTLYFFPYFRKSLFVRKQESRIETVFKGLFSPSQKSFKSRSSKDKNPFSLFL